MGLVLIYATFSNMEEAQKIVGHLIKEKIIACSNFFPVKSSFWWKGKVENSEEIVSVMKTKSENWQKVKKEIKKMHSYETPCIVKIDAEANEEFFGWVNSEVN